MFDPSEYHLTVVIPPDGLILAQKLKERLTRGGELRYEPCYIIQASQETSDLLFNVWFGHFKDGLHLVEIHFYPFLAYDEAEQFSRLDPEGALGGIQP